MFYIACVPGLALISGMQFSVESPRWLCKVQLLGLVTYYLLQFLILAALLHT